MKTNADAMAHLEIALAPHAEEFDLDAIASKIYDENGGTWDFDSFDSERFWEIAQENAR